MSFSAEKCSWILRVLHKTHSTNEKYCLIIRYWLLPEIKPGILGKTGSTVIDLKQQSNLSMGLAKNNQTLYEPL